MNKPWIDFIAPKSACVRQEATKNAVEIHDESGALLGWKIELFDQFGVVSDKSPNYYPAALAEEHAEKLNAIYADGGGQGLLLHRSDDEVRDGNWDPRRKVMKLHNAEVVTEHDGESGTWVKSTGMLVNTSVGEDLFKQLAAGIKLPISRVVFADGVQGEINGVRKRIMQSGERYQPDGYDFVGEAGFDGSAARLIVEAAHRRDEAVADTPEEEDAEQNHDDSGTTYACSAEEITETETDSGEENDMDMKEILARIDEQAQKQAELAEKIGELRGQVENAQRAVTTEKKAHVETTEALKKVQDALGQHEENAKLSTAKAEMAKHIRDAMSPKNEEAHPFAGLVRTQIEGVAGDKTIEDHFLDLADGDAAKAATLFDGVFGMAQTVATAMATGGGMTRDEIAGSGTVAEDNPATGSVPKTADDDERDMAKRVAQRIANRA